MAPMFAVRSSFNSGGVVWIDGELRPWTEATTHLTSQTMQHGFGVFEGVRAYDGGGSVHIFRLRDHTKRLLQSAKILGITVPYNAEQIDAACVGVIEANQFRAAYIRPIVHLEAEQPGVSAAGAQAHLAVLAWPWDTYLTPEARRGLKLKISSYCRHHHNAVLLKAKAMGLYVNSVLANQEARADGYDDALLLNVAGFVAEASTSNIFIARRSTVITPTLSGILEGITRETVLRILDDLSIEVIQRDISRDEVFIADEAWLTGTAIEMAPIRSLDRRNLSSCPGHVYQEVRRRFDSIVRGQGIVPDGWLTPCRVASREVS